MNRRIFYIAVSAFALSLPLGRVRAQPISAPAASTASSSQNDGRQIYMAFNCYLCHGTVGQGGAGPRIGPPGLKTGEEFAAYVRHPTGRMPAYTSALLSDADLAAIHDYLAHISPPQNLPALLTPTFDTSK